MSLFRAISTVGGLTLVSRVFGFTRDILVARYLGAGLVADTFFVAFKLPNFFRRLFAEGAFNAAFVPIFCELLGDGKQSGKARAERFASQAISVLLPILLIFTAIMQAAMPWVMHILAPGFDDPYKFDLAVQLTRATFPYLLLISLVSLMAGMLNSVERFAAAAAAPILLNLCLIGSLIFFHGTERITGEALAVAVTLAGIVQFLWLLWTLSRAGWTLRLRLPKLTPRVRQLAIVMAPAALGAGAVQVNLLIDIILASFLPDGSLSYLFYADRLNQLPIGVIGVAVGTVLLPRLSRALAAGDPESAMASQNRAIESALFFTLPAAFALMVIPGTLISVLFERGAFDAAATAATAAALTAYAAGLPAYILIKTLTPAYFSRKDTKTPVRIALIALSVNVILNIALMIPLKHVGLALATAISAWLNVGLLYFFLARRGHFQMDQRLKRRISRVVFSSVLMAGTVWLLASLLAPVMTGTLVLKILGLAGVILPGILVFLVLAHFTGAMTVQEVRALLKRRA